MKKISKKDAEIHIEEFFKEIKSKTSKEIKKIKNLAMSKKIILKEKRKLFCKYCLNPYQSTKIRIKNNLKIVECSNCGKISRWKINSF